MGGKEADGGEGDVEGGGGFNTSSDITRGGWKKGLVAGGAVRCCAEVSSAAPDWGSGVGDVAGKGPDTASIRRLAGQLELPTALIPTSSFPSVLVQIITKNTAMRTRRRLRASRVPSTESP